MIALMLIGAAIGAVVFAVVLRVAPPTPSALVQLGQLDARHRALTASRTVGAGPAGCDGGATAQTRVGRAVTAALTGRGVACTSLRQDVALTGQDFDAVMGRKVVSAVAGMLLVLLAVVGVQLTSGLALPAGAPLLLCLAAAAGFAFLPDLEARRVAGARRRDFRRALAAYLDLVSLEMAASAAPAQALTSAARVGAGWPMALLRDTLFRASRSGRDQWSALSELGVRIGVGELRDLGAMVRLVEHDGARVRSTLSARAATMRRRELADAEGQAGERDQSMRLAQVLIGFGFVVFLGYPAVVNIMSF